MSAAPNRRDVHRSAPAKAHRACSPRSRECPHPGCRPFAGGLCAKRPAPGKYRQPLRLLHRDPSWLQRGPGSPRRNFVLPDREVDCAGYPRHGDPLLPQSIPAIHRGGGEGPRAPRFGSARRNIPEPLRRPRHSRGACPGSPGCRPSQPSEQRQAERIRHPCPGDRHARAGF